MLHYTQEVWAHNTRSTIASSDERLSDNQSAGCVVLLPGCLTDCWQDAVVVGA